VLRSDYSVDRDAYRLAVFGDGWTSGGYRRAKFLLLAHVLLDMRFTLGDMRLH
jgi:hypothetical protein